MGIRVGGYDPCDGEGITHPCLPVSGLGYPYILTLTLISLSKHAQSNQGIGLDVISKVTIPVPTPVSLK